MCLKNQNHLILFETKIENDKCVWKKDKQTKIRCYHSMFLHFMDRRSWMSLPLLEHRRCLSWVPLLHVFYQSTTSITSFFSSSLFFSTIVFFYVSWCLVSNWQYQLQQMGRIIKKVFTCNKIFFYFHLQMVLQKSCLLLSSSNLTPHHPWMN